MPAYINNMEFNNYRILQLGRRLSKLRKDRDMVAREIAATEQELSDRTRARKEHNSQCKIGPITPSATGG